MNQMKQGSSSRRSRMSGFSLVELMIVIAIIGIVTTIAYPSYQGFMASTNRSVAQADLMSFATAMERHKAASFSYKGAASGGSDTGSPMIYHAHSPSQEPAANKKYDLTIESVDSTGTTYRLRARPVSSSSQKSDGDLFIYSDGRKAWDKDNNGSISTTEFCWKC